MSINYNEEGCDIHTFYEGMRNIDPNLIKKQSIQQGEIFVFMKSITITKCLLNKVINSLCGSSCHEIDEKKECDKLIVSSNQILTLGYANLRINNSITVTISSDINFVLYNGATQIIFGENIFINNGTFQIISSNLCLESKNEAKFINNGIINFKNSQFFGTGLIINNNEFIVSAYTKIYLGRVKNKTNTSDEENRMLTTNDLDEDEKCIYDFGEDSTKFINTGKLTISGYSLFDLQGYFINGNSDLASVFIEETNVCNTKLIEFDRNSKQPCSTVFIKTNSKFLFTIGDSCTDTFINDSNGLIISEANTYLRFRTNKNTDADQLKNKIISNKGTLVINGEAYFISINLENYRTIKNTIHNITSYIKNGIKFGTNFNYSKIYFINTRCDYVPELKNIGNLSIIEIAATCILHIFGYSFLNQGILAIGISKDTIGYCDRENNDFTGLEINLDESEELIIEDQNNKNLLKVIDDIKINGEFFYGFSEPNNCINVMFKNWGNIYCFYKSRVIIGYNSSSVINGKRQVILFNYGLIRNWGYLKVCRFSEIINLPSFPFNPDCKLYGIINGSSVSLKPGFLSYVKCKKDSESADNDLSIVNGNCLLNAIVIITRPIASIVTNVYTGGFIKSENRIFSNCSVFKNLSSGVIITWFGYEEDTVTGECDIIYGIDDKNLKDSNVGKLVPISYPKDLNKWPKICLTKFLEDQSISFNFDFKIS